MVKIQIEVSWFVTPCSDVIGCQGEDGGSKVLWNIGILVQHYMASLLRELIYSPYMLFHWQECILSENIVALIRGFRRSDVPVESCNLNYCTGSQRMYHGLWLGMLSQYVEIFFLWITLLCSKYSV